MLIIIVFYNYIYILVVKYKFQNKVAKDRFYGDITVADLIYCVLDDCKVECKDKDELEKNFFVTKGKKILEKRKYVAEYIAECGWQHCDEQFVISKPFNMK